MISVQDSLSKVDALIESIRQAGRVPGIALAVVIGDTMVLAKGYGYRDLDAKLPMTAGTLYPIASTSKAMNATLIGMLVDEGRLRWDAPVRDYLPRFRLGDPLTSAQVTIRDLLTMRTGLPRHDWLWMDNTITRAELVERLAFLDVSAGFRERFQYNNLTVTTAGHIAEIVTGQSWERLVQERILDPLGMSSTRFSPPSSSSAVTSCYHENSRRELVKTRQLGAEVTAPSGGSIQSTVEDMSRWMGFNLTGGSVGQHSLLRPETLMKLHSAQIVIGADPSSPSPNAAYGMGWFVDTYNGCARISHGGYIHDINSEVMLFPDRHLGIVTFTNFGPPRLARQIIQHVFDLFMGFQPACKLETTLAEYEAKIRTTTERNASVHRVAGTAPSHALDDYKGSYWHAGYGRIDIGRSGEVLMLHRCNLELPLQHWHYDAWVVAENDLFVINQPNAFDRASRILFETNEDGEISALSLPLEPAVSRVRFTKQKTV